MIVCTTQYQISIDSKDENYNKFLDLVEQGPTKIWYTRTGAYILVSEREANWFGARFEMEQF